MYSALRCFLITAFLCVFSNAESVVELGLEGVLNSMKPVPAQSTKEVEAAATKLLQDYLRPSQEGFYLRYKGTSGKWVEVKDLRFQRISYGTISNADRANGLSDRFIISLNAEMHRSQSSSQAWSEWKYGMPGFLPRNIRVEKKNGQWSASSSVLPLLEPCNDRPITIPSSIVAKPPINFSSNLPKKPNAGNASPSSQAQPTKPTSPSKSFSQAAGNLIIGAIVFGLLLILLPLALVLFLKLIFSRRKKRSSRPPQIPSNTPKPPPLPEGQQAIDLIEARTFLMTEAEQKFFAVLQPLVTPRYLISSKVRLAEIFDVLYAPGRQAAFNKISNKHIDFVLTEPGTSRILCGIELDDRSHQRPDRIERDTFVNELFASKKLPLLRIPCAYHYDPQALRQELNRALGQTLAA
jgi:hypothetical protein